MTDGLARSYAQDSTAMPPEAAYNIRWHTISRPLSPTRISLPSLQIIVLSLARWTFNATLWFQRRLGPQVTSYIQSAPPKSNTVDEIPGGAWKRHPSIHSWMVSA